MKAGQPASVIDTNGQKVSIAEFLVNPLPWRRPEWQTKSQKALAYCSVFFHVAIYACIGCAFWTYFTDGGHLGMGLELGVEGFCGAVCYGMILWEVLGSQAKQYVSGVLHEQEARRMFHDVRLNKPTLVIRATKYKTVRNSRHGTYDENVESHREERYLPLAHWVDLSEDLHVSEQLEEKGVCKVEILTAVCFLDDTSYYMWQSGVDNLAEKVHQYEGHRVETRTYIETPVKGLLVVPDSSHCAVRMLKPLFWVTCLLALGLPIRLWIWRKPGTATHTVIKAVSCDPGQSGASSPDSSADAYMNSVV